MAERPQSTLRARCPHCKRETFLKINAPREEDAAFLPEPWVLKLYPDVETTKSDDYTVYIVDTFSYCPEVDCHGPIFTCIRWELLDFSFGLHAKGGRHFTRIPTNMRMLAMHPDGRRVALDSSIPEGIRTEWDGVLELAEHRRSPATVLVACRALLESAVKELELRAVAAARMATPPKKLDLQKRIDGLAAAGIITHTLKDWAHALRLDGNDGAHELKGDPDRAIEFARFVQFFLEATFVMEARLARVQRLPTNEPPDEFDELLGMVDREEAKQST